MELHESKKYTAEAPGNSHSQSRDHRLCHIIDWEEATGLCSNNTVDHNATGRPRGHKQRRPTSTTHCGYNCSDT